MNVWLPAVFGLVGTLLGAFVSGAAAYAVQKHQARSALELRRTESEMAAVERLEAGLWKLRQYIKQAPEQSVKRWSEEDRAEWGIPIADRIGPLSIAARRIGDDDLRARLVDAFVMIGDWGAMTSRVHPIRYIPPIVEHALDCLGAWHRGENIPPPDYAFTQFKELREARYSHTSASA
ncbi:hypothetical protein [Streptomyces sp. NPDC000618]|uniref:hypothetical protein n=1 Tax=Streptomyces sp. NPDC000618 TaxID=3154265 RepID=UPI00332FDC71